MSMLDRLRGRRPGTDLALTESAGPVIEGELVGEIDTAVHALQEASLHVQEAYADAELAMEDAGWRKITTNASESFSRAGLRQASAVGRAMAATNPLIGRALALRHAYVWGEGCTITARATGKDGGQDVNAVVQATVDDEANKTAWFGEQAREENERALGTDGQVFAVLFTGMKTGAVQVRTLPWDEIEDVIANPDDRAEAWYYLRCYTAPVITPDGTITREAIKELHPSLNYRPRVRLAQVKLEGQLIDVRWDAPVLHVSVNRAKDTKWGVGDVYTALPWARAYRDFLADWAQLVKALSRFAWRRSPGAIASKTQKAAQKIKDAAVAAEAAAAAAAVRAERPRTGEGTESTAGAIANAPEGALEAIPKTGATVDSESGRPLAAMVAAGVGLPVTMLLADPGVTGARATATTLDEPTKLILGTRRTRWAEADRRILAYAITEAVRAPQGPLKGTVIRDEFGREQVRLAQDTDPQVEIVFPPLEKTDPKAVLEALKIADELGVPPKEIVRLALEVIGVEDVDGVLEEMTDKDGNFTDPAVAAAARVVGARQRGDAPDSLYGQPAPAVPAQRAATEASATT